MLPIATQKLILSYITIYVLNRIMRFFPLILLSDVTKAIPLLNYYYYSLLDELHVLF